MYDLFLHTVSISDSASHPFQAYRPLVQKIYYYTVGKSHNYCTEWPGLKQTDFRWSDLRP